MFKVVGVDGIIPSFATSHINFKLVPIWFTSEGAL